MCFITDIVFIVFCKYTLFLSIYKTFLLFSSHFFCKQGNLISFLFSSWMIIARSSFIIPVSLASWML